MNPEVADRMTRSFRILFFIFIIHTLLIVYSAFYMSERAWGFISSVLFYVIFGVYMVFELVRNRLKNRNMAIEWLPVVDVEGNIKGKIPRSEVHKGNKILHPVVHLHVFNASNELFLEKRAMNKLVQAGKWDTAVGGHISFGENIDESLKRETFEELGISVEDARFVTKYVWESDIESELVFVFVYLIPDGSLIRVNRDEISEGRFWKLTEIRANLDKGIFTPNFEKEFRDFILKMPPVHIR